MVKDLKRKKLYKASVLSLKFLFIVETACKKCGSWRKDGLSFFITLFVFFFCSYTTGSTIYIKVGFCFSASS